ncbi:PREDICTED: tyrosine-protein kinase SYK-like [Acropora digitifera]|uniref:tyrosine-protein kinase SYK-like n=1 Tax=Acropora digitifera TaxID=70779 RepID=UPI00077A5101|nr:PREDICTED: tyrosine-protein kinase SYK-like [Acropora digitifera]
MPFSFEQIRGHVNIGPSSSFSSGKKSKDKFEFAIKAEKGKKYLLRVGTESLRLQWINSLELAAQGKPSPERFAPLQETVEEEKTSNQYTEVPNPTCSTSSDICEVIQEDMNKMFSRKHNSFGDHCKRLLRTKSKSFCQEQESREPVSEGTDAKSEPFYDIVPHQNPPWYFGKLSREQSEEILQNYEPGRYLVRNSESVHKPGAYTLSLKHRDRCRHHKIETLPDGNLVIKQHEDKPFPNLVMLMAYFVKSQERDIRLEPVICEKREGTF